MKIAKDKEGHYILIQGFGRQEGTVVLKVSGPNNRIPRYMKQNCRTEERNRPMHNYS